MKPTNDELIKEYIRESRFDKDWSVRDFLYGKLKGRLDILEVCKYSGSCPFEFCLHDSSREECEVNKQIKKIKEVIEK